MSTNDGDNRDAPPPSNEAHDPHPAVKAAIREKLKPDFVSYKAENDPERKNKIRDDAYDRVLEEMLPTDPALTRKHMTDQWKSLGPELARENAASESSSQEKTTEEEETTVIPSDVGIIAKTYKPKKLSPADLLAEVANLKQELEGMKKRIVLTPEGAITQTYISQDTPFEMFPVQVKVTHDLIALFEVWKKAHKYPYTLADFMLGCTEEWFEERNIKRQYVEGAPVRVVENPA